MADRSEIEPYRRDKQRQPRFEDKKYQRGASNEDRRSQEQRQHEISPNYDRKSQERQDYENRNYEAGDYPPSILKRRDINYDRDYRYGSKDSRPRDYGNYNNPRNYSRSPPKEDWRSRESDSSPAGYDDYRKSSVSPLRPKEDSPHIASPREWAPFVQIDDPVERKSLIAQLDDLKHRLHYDYTKDNAEINELRKNKENEIRDILQKKDALVEESHHRIQNLKREIEEEERKAERIREENILMQKNHSVRVSELQNQIEASQGRLDQIKREHEEAVRNQIRQQDEEKKALREDYERLIEQVRKEYQATREELKDILNDRNNQVDQAKNKLNDLKKYYADEMETLKKEVDYLQESIQTSKKLNEKQNQEFEIARKTNKNLQKENYSLQKEISNLEKQASKYEGENEDLRNKIMRLDKLVYGKTKSPFKKFYN